jgi:hypothetical protein
MYKYFVMEDINKYIKENGLSKQKTVEETMIVVLEHLSNNKRNSMNVAYKSELISSASVILNGITKFKNPLKVYELLGRAMDKRGFCAFPNTVTNAFGRTYQEAVKKGQEKEALNVWKSFNNRLVKASAARFVPIEEFIELLRKSNGMCQFFMSRHFKFRNDIGLTDIIRVMNSNARMDGKELNCAKAILKHKDASKEQKELARFVVLSSGNIKKGQNKSNLKGIRGKRKERTEIMKKRTRSLRK